MKKKIILLLSFLFACLFQLNTSAEILGTNSSGVTASGSYMVIAGGTEEYLNDNQIYYHFYDDIGFYITEGNMTVNCVESFGDNTFKLTMYAEIEDNGLTRFTASFNGEQFFEFYIDCDYVYVIQNKEIDLCYMYNDYTSRVKHKSHNVDMNVTWYRDYDLDSLPADVIDYFLAFLQGGDYKLNEAYIGKEPHITMEYDNTITMDDILSFISVEDLTEGEITDFSIIDNTFDENNPEVGEYTFRIVAKDTSGNTTVQRVWVNIVDIQDPVVEMENFSVSYTTLLEEDDIAMYLSVTDHSNYSSYFYFDDYALNYLDPGDYDCYVTVTDDYDNSTTVYFTITVIDDIPPALGIPDYIDVDTLTYYDEDYLRDNYFEAIDAIDGDVTGDIVFNDLDDYASNYSTPGIYHFQATAVDYSNNEITLEFYIHSIDYDYPEIHINQYTIFVSEGEVMTKEDILKMLNALGRDTEDADVDCSYFYEDNPSGEFELTITYNDGTTVTDRIITYCSSNISMDDPEVKEKKNYTPIIIASSVGGALAIVFTVLGIIIYKKRH